MNEEQEMYYRHLSDPSWRLNNLYKIVTKNGQVVLFKLNWAQQQLHENLYFQNVILKARQLGISTYVCLYFLDVCLFKANTSAGIIAHTKEDAEHMFKRIKFAYDQLPSSIKSLRVATVDSARELIFNNNSSLRVGTSMRGSTLQYLHISEFGKICAHFPDKAREIITGSLNTLGNNNYIFIESTAEGKEGYFYDICKQAEALQVSNAKLTTADYKFHFFPWHKESDYSIKETCVIPKETEEYFDTLADKGIILTEFQKSWYYKRLLIQLDDMKREFPSTPDEAFESSIDGSFYAKWIRDARFEGRIGEVPWDKEARVCVAFDPGYLDQCAVVFWQNIGQEIHVIDYYENSGEGLEHYLSVIRSKPYIYETFFGPHDIKQHHFSMGMSTKEVAAKHGINIIPVDEIEKGLDAGIEAVRNIFPRLWIDKKNCDRLIKCLENYKKQWDINTRIYKSKPVHNEYSHGCFVADTKIEMKDGQKNICNICEGDLVLTPNGYKKVLRTFCYDANFLLKVETTSSFFECTHNHKVFTENGLIYADALRYDEVIYSLKDNDLWKKFGICSKESNIGFRETFISVNAKSTFGSMGINSDGTEDIIADTQKWDIYTRQCGEKIEEKSQTDGTPIIEMEIPETTVSKILKSSAPANIQDCTCNLQKEERLPENSLVMPSNTPKNGIQVLKEFSGIEIMQKDPDLEDLNMDQNVARNVKKSLMQKSRFISSVPMDVNQKIDGTGDLMMNPEDAKCAISNTFATNIPIKERVVKIALISCPQDQKVYDFEVEDDHCYYANGILVSNSDAFRYTAIAIKGYIDSDKSGINDAEAERLYNKYHPRFD